MPNPSQASQGNVLSVDLAHASYADNGMAFLKTGGIDIEFIHPDTLGVEGRPQAESFAEGLDVFCLQNVVSVLLLDGPQGWRFPASQIQHMRLCERVLNTPGKTGVVGQVKPKTYFGYIQFSIDLFAALRRRHGWILLTHNWHQRPARRWIVESFPTASWKTLGLPSLPAKGKASREDLQTWRVRFEDQTGLRLPKTLTHDQLQAAVVLPAGQRIAQRHPAEVILAGVDPFLDEEGNVLEGLIALPRVGE